MAFVDDYDMHVGHFLVQGCDVWLNNQRRPLEASGTSGMKAALNGVPSLSVLDGWWIEGHVEGITGWSIGGIETDGDQSKDANEIYLKLERVILPLYYGLPFAYAEVMRSAIRLGSLAAFLVGGLIVFFTFGVVVDRRRREVALLRSLGARRGQVAAIFVREALIIGVAGAVLGMVVHNGPDRARITRVTFLQELPVEAK